MEGPKKEKIGPMFDAIAPDYDRLNHLMSLGIDKSWRRRALKQVVEPKQSQQILDLACGTGDFSLAIAAKSHPDTRVAGVDLSEGMLSVMREKVAAAGLGNRISAELGDAEHLPFGEGCFDRVTIAFGVRNFEHREAALREVRRVLKPGGKLVILELSVPSNPFIRGCYNLYFTKLMPLIGGRISGERSAYRYLPASVLKFPGKEEWMATMAACGFRDVTHRAYTLGICRLYTGTK